MATTPPYNNHIDLTLSDDDLTNSQYRYAKRVLIDPPSSSSPSSSHFVPSHFYNHYAGPSMPSYSSPSPQPTDPPFIYNQQLPLSNQPIYRPPFAGPAPLPFMSPRHTYQQHQHTNPFQQQHIHHHHQTPPSSATSRATASPSSVIHVPQLLNSDRPNRQVIDLTSSPSPPPPTAQPVLNPPPPDLPPKNPVCIGQLQVTALVLYPVPYLLPRDPNSGEYEWAVVRLQYEHNPNNPGGSETIHIRTPHGKGPNGESIPSEAFGVIEQKVATYLGPMLGKGLIRLDAMVKKGAANLPILPLQMLVYTPKGNIPVVGDYLQKCGLLLDRPIPPFDLGKYCYLNPHNPPPGGHNRAIMASNRLGYGPQRDQSRWGTPVAAGKSVEVQRSQVDELFKNLKDGEELAETEPCADVSTKLYPHQKKALTFLLDREREKSASLGKGSYSLWQIRVNPMTRQQTWSHVVTQKEMEHEPHEAKGSILADDMGLGKTITCVSLIGATLKAAKEFASSPVELISPPPPRDLDAPNAAHFAGSVWGMPEIPDGNNTSAKGKAKQSRMLDKLEADFTRACRIKTKSRATLIICPLSTVSNWEDQFREHWGGEVTVFGGSGGICMPATASQAITQICNSQSTMVMDEKPDVKPVRIRGGTPLRVYVYHGNARRPDPTFLADFDAVITTYATLASEFSKQNRSVTAADDEDDDGGGSSDATGGVDTDEAGNQVLKVAKAKRTGLKRKKSTLLSNGNEATSALQSIHWFRVVLDEAHSIKETGTVGSRASCDLVADRRLCLTGTPVQNKLDDVFALIKFLRLEPFDDKNVWTEYIGSPVKFGHSIGVIRLQTIMKCITLRRTKESKTNDGKHILALPPRRDELRRLVFDAHEKEIYDQFFNESKAEFNDLSDKNEVMKNYVGILQKILRLRQICDHFELVQGKEFNREAQDCGTGSYEDILADIAKEGINAARAGAIFAILRESATTQCVECGGELCSAIEASQADGMDVDGPPPAKRSRKGKPNASRAPTRASSPSSPRPILTRCQHLFCLECYRNSICPGWPEVSPDTRRSCSACQTGLSPFDAVEIKPEADPSLKRKPPKREKRQKGGSLENFHPSTKVKALLADLIVTSRVNPYSNNFDPESVEIQMVDGQGNDMPDVIKTVVFSQWTSMLDKIEDALEAACIRYDRLDGTMKRDERTRAMDALKHDPGCEVLLVSLKAGGVGLNLTAAQRVYLMDPYWNPAVENQAVDRIHRLGQTRPVTTVKFIIENSIEDRLLEVQKKKTELANMTLGHSFSKAELLQRRMDDLAQLFDS